MSKRVLEALNDEINNFNIMVGLSIHETKGSDDNDILIKLKHKMMDIQTEFVKDIERLHYN